MGAWEERERANGIGLRMNLEGKMAMAKGGRAEEGEGGLKGRRGRIGEVSRLLLVAFNYSDRTRYTHELEAWCVERSIEGF